MKFGRQLSDLVHPKFRNYCVAYNMLKGYIRDTEAKSGKIFQTIQDATSVAVPFLPQAQADQLPEVLFQNALNSELEKVNRFCLLEEEVLLNDIRAVMRELRLVDKLSTETLESLRTELDRVADELVAFGSFINLNHTAFRKITKKESKIHKTSSAAWFMANVARAPFMNVDFDRLVTALSICHELLREPDTDKLGLLAPTPRDTKPRAARVLSAWVSQDELLSVKVALSKVMKLQFTGIDTSSGKDVLESILSSRNKRIAEISHKVNATYLDTPWMESYEKETSKAVEWYGFQVESAAHTSTITLPSGGIIPGISSRSWEKLWTSKGQAVSSKLKDEQVNEIRTLVNNGYVPLVDCSFDRYVFRALDEDHGQIEVCLDENISFVSHTKKDQALSDTASKFTGNVLYVTVPEDSPRDLPDWLVEIIRVPGITEIPQFSKRIQGLYVYADQVLGGHNVPRPHWAPQKPPPSTKPNRVRFSSAVSPIIKPLDDKNISSVGDTRRVRTEDVMSNATRMVAYLLGDRTSLMDGEIQVRDAMVKIEPKSFFACERTLLDWTHTTVLVTGLAALSGGTVGMLVALIPIAILLWEARLHRVRNLAMKNKECRDYSDPLGPPLLILSLSIIFSVVLLSSLLQVVRTQ